MKKIFASLLLGLLFVITFALSACGDKTNGTYYPTFDEMKNNLENSGYMVNTLTGIDNDIVTTLSANKENNHIVFYWLKNASDCQHYYDNCQELHPDWEVLISIENDEKFGNIVYCGTEQAINDAGITIVDVKIKV